MEDHEPWRVARPTKGLIFTASYSHSSRKWTTRLEGNEALVWTPNLRH
jgi:hypothetical protein